MFIFTTLRAIKLKILFQILQLYLARVLVESMFKGPLKKHLKKDQDIENFKVFHTNSYIYPTMMAFTGEQHVSR